MIQPVPSEEFRTAKMRVSRELNLWETGDKQDDKPLRQALEATKGDIQRWQMMNGGYLGQNERLLRDQVGALEALVDLHLQRKKPSW